MKPKLFKVAFYYQEIGTTTVMAKNASQAKKKIYKRLEADGIEGMEIDQINREYDTTDAEVVDDGLFVGKD